MVKGVFVAGVIFDIVVISVTIYFDFEFNLTDVDNIFLKPVMGVENIQEGVLYLLIF